MKFYCTSCNLDFETASPVKKDYSDYLLGSCWKYVAGCPLCGMESDEKRIPKPRKSESFATSQNYCGGNCDSCGI